MTCAVEPGPRDRPTFCPSGRSAHAAPGTCVATRSLGASRCGRHSRLGLGGPGERAAGPALRIWLEGPALSKIESSSQHRGPPGRRVRGSRAAAPPPVAACGPSSEPSRPGSPRQPRAAPAAPHPTELRQRAPPRLAAPALRPSPPPPPPPCVLGLQQECFAASCRSSSLRPAEGDVARRIILLSKHRTLKSNEDSDSC